MQLNEDSEIANPACADDLDMINKDEVQREEKLYVLKEEGASVGLEISEVKTKTMEASREAFVNFRPDRSGIIADQDIEEVRSFKYLGSLIQANNDCEPDVDARIAAANRAAGSLNQLLRSRILSRRAKLAVNKTVIRPVALYGSEVWSTTQRIEKKLDSFENNVLKTICGKVFDPDLNLLRRRYARVVRAPTGLPPISGMVRSGRLRWAGHVLRADASRDIKQHGTRESCGFRRAGGPESVGGIT